MCDDCDHHRARHVPPAAASDQQQIPKTAQNATTAGASAASSGGVHELAYGTKQLQLDDSRGDILMHMLSGCILGALNKQGIRGTVYRLAQQYLAFALADHKECIKYGVNETENDLNIKLYFKSEHDALLFRNALFDMRDKRRLVGVDDVAVDADCTPMLLSRSRIFAVIGTQYDPALTGSPMQSLEQFRTVPSTSSHTSEEALVGHGSDLETFQALEEVQHCVRMTEMHIWDKADAKKNRKPFVRDRNNLIAGYDSFHLYFDGRQTRSFTPGRHNIPLLNLTYLDHSDVRDAANGHRYRVNVRISYRNLEAVHGAVIRWKAGTTEVEGDPLSKDTFIYVTDPQITKECLVWKADKTSSVWRSCESWDDDAADDFGDSDRE